MRAPRPVPSPTLAVIDSRRPNVLRIEVPAELLEAMDAEREVLRKRHAASLAAMRMRRGLGR